jgi:leader peptidase (prepilin peptidase) / N-methyltransferase
MRDSVLTVFAAVLGGIIGSFLNACIHRMPRGISLNNPRRSFCPSCNRQIPWYENLPVVSWVMLRGKCSGCAAKISPRYVLVEILTAALFLAAWLVHGLPLAPVYWLFIAILITATFIDFEHFIIPDELTWGGTIAGVVLSAALPTLMGTDSHWRALGLSLAGATLGYGLLWGIVEFGKLAFGKKKHSFPEPQPFSVLQEGETIVLTVGEEKLPWEEIFSWRENDELVLEAPTARLGERELVNTTLRFRMNKLLLDGAETPLEQVEGVHGMLRTVTIPREAMGFGDVKFIAAIGAFLGWQAVLFTVCAASIIGCVAALAGLFIARDKAGARVPFGPFLALGAIIWVFGGTRLWDWYFALLRPGGAGIGF